MHFTVLLTLDFSSETPIYQQIRNGIVLGIADGRLLAGEKLPPIRLLAGELGVNVMTVNKAYQLLKQEGYLKTDRRNGAIVMPMPGAPSPRPFGSDPDSPVYQSLRLLLSELSVRGVTREELLTACSQIYDELHKKGDSNL